MTVAVETGSQIVVMPLRVESMEFFTQGLWVPGELTGWETISRVHLLRAEKDSLSISPWLRDWVGSSLRAKGIQLLLLSGGWPVKYWHQFSVKIWPCGKEGWGHEKNNMRDCGMRWQRELVLDELEVNSSEAAQGKVGICLEMSFRPSYSFPSSSCQRKKKQYFPERKSIRKMP